MMGYEKVLMKSKPDLCMVVGDCHLHNGMCYYSTKDAGAGSSCRGRDTVGRHDNAGGDKPDSDRQHHRLVLYYFGDGK